MTATQEQKKTNAFNAFLSKFLEKNRLLLIIIFAAVLLLIVGYIIVSEQSARVVERSTLLSERMQEAYIDWLSADEAGKGGLETEILTLYDTILEKYPKRYAAMRARFIMGDFYFEKGEWAESAAEYTALADLFPESYLAVSSLMNAGAAAEELADLEKAAALYRRVIDTYEDLYPDVPRAYFSLGRILETLQKNDEAVGIYNACIDRFPDSNWTKLARDRIIYLAAMHK
jgi:tetratricopeptide (TPR) repeat protein